MQNELIKHTRKIYRIFKSNEQRIMSKAQEILIEIIIIVFAVTFSIWIHELKERNKQQKDVMKFLENIKTDITNDLIWLRSDVEAYKLQNDKLEAILLLTPFQLDSIQSRNEFIEFPMHIFMNKINNANYEGFKSSGRIVNIKNENLKIALLNYYQQDGPNTVEINGLYNQYLLKTLDYINENADKNVEDIYQSLKFKVNFLLMIGKNNEKVYNDKPIRNAMEIIKAIDLELKE